jgi:hypothetical protein
LGFIVPCPLLETANQETPGAYLKMGRGGEVGGNSRLTAWQGGAKPHRSGCYAENYTAHSEDDFAQSWTLIFYFFFAKKRLISTWSRKLQNTSQKKNQEVN